jgi:quercetin dioxygenase-like cupin family protein
MIAMIQKRVFENPKIKDKVTLIKSSRETDHTYTLVEVELAAGGGNAFHFHTSFTEEFTAVDGVLGIGLKGGAVHLKPGETTVAKPNELHRFYNPGNQSIRFMVKLSPGAEHFEKSLAIGYGLAGDGLTNKQGIPSKMDHLAVLLELSDTRFNGFLGLITPLLLRRARKARQRGVLQQLEERYFIN